MNIKEFIEKNDSLCGFEKFVIFDNEHHYECGNLNFSLAKLERDQVISSFGDRRVLRFFFWYVSDRVDILILQRLDEENVMK